MSGAETPFGTVVLESATDGECAVGAAVGETGKVFDGIFGLVHELGTESCGKHAPTVEGACGSSVCASTEIHDSLVGYEL